MMKNVYTEQAKVLSKGEEFYLENLKGKFEKEHSGKYLAIDVDTNAYILDSDKFKVVERAQKQFGAKLFYMVQVGDLVEPTANFRERQNVAWIFS